MPSKLSVVVIMGTRPHLMRRCLRRDIVKKSGNYVMEDWLHWTECFSHLVAPDDVLAAVDRRLAEMWGLLRAAVCHYARATAPDSVYPFTPAACDEAADNLWQYAVMVEKARASHACSCMHPARPTYSE